MFVYNKQKSQNVESTMLKQVEIDASKTSRNTESKNTESKIIIRVENRKRDEVNSTQKSEWIIQSEKSNEEYRAKLVMS